MTQPFFSTIRFSQSFFTAWCRSYSASTIYLSLQNTINLMKIFISYTTEDLEPYLIFRIVHDLEEMDTSIHCFFWKRDCFAGKSNLVYMLEKIAECEIFLLFCSEKAKISAPVNQEIGIAMAHKKTIIPIYRNFEKDVHFNIGLLRCVPFSAKKYKEFFSELIQTIKNTKPEIQEMKHSEQHNIYLKLDEQNNYLSRLAFDHPEYLILENTQHYETKFSVEKATQYGVFAKMIWDFCETIYDLTKENPELFQTWEPILIDANRLHRTWFNNAIKLNYFKEPFIKYIQAHFP